MGSQATERVLVESREGTIAYIVLPLPSGGIQFVVQGFLEHHLMPGKSVALDGFYKYSDETVSEMKGDEFWDFS